MNNNKRSHFFVKQWMLVLWLLASSSAFAQAPFELAKVKTEAGQSHSYIAEEHDIKVPVTVIHGTQPGPVLLLTAGVHGDEFPAILALQRLREEVDAKQLKGTLIMVHLANLPGFHARRVALHPADNKNLNREFPGDKNGTPTEQLAEFFTREFISRIDFLIDMHSGSWNQQLWPHVYSPFVGDQQLDDLTFEFAKAIGMQHIVMYGERPRDPANSISYPNTAMTRGKPGLTTEIGHLGQRDEASVEDTLTLSRNALYFLEMLPGKPMPHSDPIIYDKLKSVASPADGLFTPRVEIGSAVEKGTIVGDIRDYFGNIVAELTAPVSGTVLMINDTPPVKAGETPVTIGIEQEN
ncbi:MULTISPECIES: M14 family metallopeptidase [unclassified Methylophaga]|uniref:succinylglutamate desuccinylase/aspartoacylase family protein n=1 Tax=unclassified Methylophaga TaxID=2629249 RepID=UPI0025E3A676|nr:MULTISPECIES: M14 family metallopeptidase [unclassified Methylophaga]|tara:strand:+ start:34397 stop:35452 length:1056 start_codon:yes stop_codon:yes gene_type:complete